MKLSRWWWFLLMQVPILMTLNTWSNMPKLVLWTKTLRVCHMKVMWRLVRSMRWSIRGFNKGWSHALNESRHGKECCSNKAKSGEQKRRWLSQTRHCLTKPVCCSTCARSSSGELVRAEQNSASRRSLEGVLVRALSIGFLLGRFGLRLHWCGALHLCLIL